MGQVERNKRGTWLQALWYLSDLIAVLGGFLLGYGARFHSPLAAWIPPVKGIPPLSMYILAGVATVLLWIPLFHLMGFYRLERGKTRHRRRDLLRGLLIGILIMAGVGFFYRGASFSRLAILLTWGFSSLLILSGRSIVQTALPRWARLRPIRFAVVGRTPAAGRLVNALAASSFPHEFTGCFEVAGDGEGSEGRPHPDPSAPGESASLREASTFPAGNVHPRRNPRRASAGTARETMTEEPAATGAAATGGTATATTVAETAARAAGREAPEVAAEAAMTNGEPIDVTTDLRDAPSLGPASAIRSVARARNLDLIIMAGGADSPGLLERVYAQCQELDLDFQFVPDLLSLWARRVRVEEVDGLPVLRLRDLPLVGWNGVVKRTLDLLASGCLLVLLSPVLLALAVAVRLDSPGPVFLRQERMGRDRRPFAMLKLRSMRPDAEQGTGPVWTGPGDERRTRIGKFLRRWSLDELPQLWNVFRGQMSLVGPRPERPFFVHQFEERVRDYYDRHRVKSGMTGWAQVHGLRGSVPIEDRTAYDLYYVEHWSLLLDLRILWMTLSAVVTHRGE
jgi:exopolysaccharide biosynthesis polyprenyl glycosylphosphotransferase